MSVYFKSGGKININQLQVLGNSTKEHDESVRKLLYVPGVFNLPASISKNFLIEMSDATHINVGYIDLNQTAAAFGGIAIDKKGRIIKIIENQSYVISELNPSEAQVESHIYFNEDDSVWEPQRTDDPNLAGFSNNGPEEIKGYARNSGNYNIPITAGVRNYVYIRYQEVVTQNASSSQTVDTKTYETEFKDGYVIKVVKNQNDPSIVDDDTWIYIGQVDATTDALNTSPDGLPIASNELMQLGYLNGSTVGAPYYAATGRVVYPTNSGKYIDLETHINALGTGIPSATNPHGLSAADIGANVNNAGFNSVQTITAANTSTYTLGAPLLDLSKSSTVAQSYDIIIVDAKNAPTSSEVTIRLPEASIDTTAYKYTFKAADASTSTVISVSTLIPENTSTNLIDGGVSVTYGEEDPKTYSKLTLDISDSVTLVVGLTSTGYNWWRI